MKLLVMRAAAIAACAGLAVHGGSAACQDRPTATGASMNKGAPLRAVVSTDKSEYALADVVEFLIVVVNESNAPVYVYGMLDGSVAVAVKNVSTGEYLEPGVIPERPPPPGSKAEFVEIRPDNVYGWVYRARMRHLGVRGPGVYEVHVAYHNPISRGFSFGLAVWAMEDGPVQAKPVVFTVKP